jgi:hypothetical protein
MATFNNVSVILWWLVLLVEESYVLLADDHEKQCELYPLRVNQKNSSVFLCIV